MTRLLLRLAATLYLIALLTAIIGVIISDAYYTRYTW